MYLELKEVFAANQSPLVYFVARKSSTKRCTERAPPSIVWDHKKLNHKIRQTGFCDYYILLLYSPPHPTPPPPPLSLFLGGGGEGLASSFTKINHTEEIIVDVKFEVTRKYM